MPKGSLLSFQTFSLRAGRGLKAPISAPENTYQTGIGCPDLTVAHLAAPLAMLPRTLSFATSGACAFAILPPSTHASALSLQGTARAELQAYGSNIRAMSRTACCRGCTHVMLTAQHAQLVIHIASDCCGLDPSCSGGFSGVRMLQDEEHLCGNHQCQLTS